MGTITLDQSSRLVRFYTRTWDANPNSINLCKLFWGVIFSPIVWVGRLAYFLVGQHVTNYIQKHMSKVGDWSDDDMARWAEKKARKDKRRKERLQRWTDRMTKMKLVFDRFWRVARWIVWPAIIIGTIAVLIFIVYVVVNHAIAALTALGIFIGTVAGLVLLALLLVTLDEKGHLLSGWDSFAGFWKIMWQGAKAFKHNTCPKIEVK